MGGGVLTEFTHPAALLGAVLGGLAADVLVQVGAARAARWPAVVAGVAIPALVWSGQLAGLAVDARVAWSVELWAGVVIMTALTGAVLAGLLPAAEPAPAGRPATLWREGSRDLPPNFMTLPPARVER